MSRKALELQKGQVFGKLTVICRVENKNKQSQWLCQCECGNEVTVIGGHLTSGLVRSCGCLRIKHGLSKNRIYQIWRDMNRRCYNPMHKDYKNYGQRGIGICPEWRGENGLLNFYNWTLECGEYSDDLTIDRIDVNGDYEPGNCRWATDFEQHNNCRSNRYYTDKNGVTNNIAAWSRITGLGAALIIYRLNHGWTDPLVPVGLK